MHHALISGLEVNVLNVQPTTVLHGDYFSQEMLARIRTDALEHGANVNAEALRMLSAAGIQCSSHESVGEVIAEIGKAVTTLGCDTIVMGTRGMSSLSNLVLGSVASRVVHDVSVPVLLVK
jgi:nucleotide-binding universal stress UspA family protein